MSSFYGTVKHGDEVSPGWMQNVEDGLGAGTPAQHPEYVLWKSGTTYYRRNGRTGARTSDSNFGDLLNETILDMFDGGAGLGGVIHLKSGYYTLDKTINMRPAIRIVGACRGGVDPPTILSTVISLTTDTTMFSFDYPNVGHSHQYHGGLHMMWLEYTHGTDDRSSYPIIDIQCNNINVGDTWLTDLEIYHGKYGIRICNNHASNMLWNVFIERCMPEIIGYAGILLDSPTDQMIKQCRIINNHFYSCCMDGGNGAIEIDGHDTRGGIIANNTFELENRHGIYLTDEADGWTIVGNTLIDCGQATTNTYSGIHMLDVDYCTVSGNTSIYRANNKMKYGIYSDNNCTYCCIIGNVTRGQTAGLVVGSGTGMIGGATTNVSAT